MDLLKRGLLQDMRVRFSDLIQAHVLKPGLAHPGDHQVAGKAGMVLPFPGNCIPNSSYSKRRLPTEGFCFDNMPFSNEKYFHQKAPHPVCSQTANVNLSSDPRGTRGCEYIKDSLTRLWREAHPALALQLSSGLRQLPLATLPSARGTWDWGRTINPGNGWLHFCLLP